MRKAADVTPWGEMWRDLALAAILDRRAPLCLRCAAVWARLGDDSELRALVGEAVALHEREIAEGCREEA